MPKSSTGKEFKELKVQYTEVASIIPYERNSKVHPPEQVAKLKASIQEYNFDQPIVVDKEMVVIKGHGRLMAAQALGLDKVPVIVRDDLTPQQVKAARIADNKVVSAMFDDDMLMLEIGELKEFDDFDATLLGFDDAELKSFEDAFNAEDAMKEAEEKRGMGDDIPDVPDKYDIHPGDMFQLGNHRIICGSSTDALVVQKLLGEEKVDMLLTDPPYGVAVADRNKELNKRDGGNRNEKAIKSDAGSGGVEDYRKFFGEFLSIIPMADKNTAYVCLNGQEVVNLRLAMADSGFLVSQELVWAKNNHALSRKDYQPKHELVLYGWKGAHEFFGPRNRMSVVEYARPQKAADHPTMKPVVMFEDFIKDGSQPGDIVYDAFSGSGTTIMACQNTGRHARVVELDPHYVNLAIARWEKFTGKEAVLVKEDQEPGEQQFTFE